MISHVSNPKKIPTSSLRHALRREEKAGQSIEALMGLVDPHCTKEQAASEVLPTLADLARRIEVRPWPAPEVTT